MWQLEKHEIFEIEVLDKLKSSLILNSLIFGGGTMLRLCHELPRYSVDLDFWKLKNEDDNLILEKLKISLGKDYEITDAKLKRYTILIEIRSEFFPKRLKIEIRRKLSKLEYEEKIAFSPSSNKQVLLKALTLEESLRKKIEALLSRNAIRDAFDVEFLLRKNTPLPRLSREEIKRLVGKISNFKLNDFKVSLGSVLTPEWREYYVKNGFEFLLEKLNWRLLQN